jgi:hypothetical protein
MVNGALCAALTRAAIVTKAADQRDETGTRLT